MVNENNAQEPKPRSARKPRSAKAKNVEEFGGIEDIIKELNEDSEASVSVPRLTRDELEREADDARRRYEESLARLQEYDETEGDRPTPPGFWRAFSGSKGLVNVFAWVGLFFTFTFFPLGFIFSGIGVVNSRAVPEDKFGKFVAWVGFILSTIAVVFLFAYFLIMVFALLSGGWLYPESAVRILAPGPLPNPVPSLL